MIWTNEEREAVIDYLSVNPDAGVVVPGSYGLRKVRWAASGRGKRGGARVICAWQTRVNEVYLVTVFLKSDQSDVEMRLLRKLGLTMRREFGE